MITINPVFSLGEKVYFLGDGSIVEGVIASIVYTDIDMRHCPSKYLHTVQNGTSYGVAVRREEVVMLREALLFSKASDCAKALWEQEVKREERRK